MMALSLDSAGGRSSLPGASPRAKVSTDQPLARKPPGNSGSFVTLFRVDVTQTRDDYDSLTSIAGPYNDALDMLSNAQTQDDSALKDKMMKEAEKRYAAARLAAFRAPELTTTVGRNQVLEALSGSGR